MSIEVKNTIFFPLLPSSYLMVSVWESGSSVIVAGCENETYLQACGSGGMETVDLGKFSVLQIFSPVF